MNGDGSPPLVLFVFQNAWRRGAKPEEQTLRHERAWMRLLWRSQTGKRLLEMIPDGINFDVVNASPFVGRQSFASFTADALLMHARMQRLRPVLVVLCGKVAHGLAHVVEQHERPYLRVPHPASRRLSKAETARIREEVAGALSDH